MKVSIIGAGTMGTGIAQIAATKGHEVCLYDSSDGASEQAKEKLKKGKVSTKKEVDIVESLENVKRFLLNLKKEL